METIKQNTVLLIFHHVVFKVQLKSHLVILKKKLKKSKNKVFKCIVNNLFIIIKRKYRSILNLDLSLWTGFSRPTFMYCMDGNWLYQNFVYSFTIALFDCSYALARLGGTGILVPPVLMINLPTPLSCVWPHCWRRRPSTPWTTSLTSS